MAEFTTFTMGKAFPSVLEMGGSRVLLADSASRTERQKKIDQLTGEIAALKRQSDKEAAEAKTAREKATKAKQDAEKAETAAIKEEGEAAEAKRKLDAKIAELAQLQSTPAPAQAPAGGKKK